MKRRSNGEGSYGKRTIKGNEYFYYRDPEGHFTYGKTQAELKEKIESKQNNPRTPALSKYTTVGEYVRDWLYGHKYKEVKLTVQSTTFDSYEAALNKRFFEFDKYPLAKRQLSALTSSMIQEYLRSLASKYSRASIKKTWEVLRLCFVDDTYKNYHLLPKIDYRRIKLPTESNVSVKKKNLKFTSEEDMEILYNEAFKKNEKSGHKYGNASRLIVFVMYSGLRVSEACGLKWRDVNLEDGLISINESHTIVAERDASGRKIGNIHIDKAPKTDSSLATIPYRKRAGEMLELMMKEFPDHEPYDYVFLNDAGKPYNKNLVKRTFDRMIKHAGLENRGYTVHSLRHGYGSILFNEGVDIKTISKLLRHKDIQTTANIYVETTTDTLKAALDKIDEKG